MEYTNNLGQLYILLAVLFITLIILLGIRVFPSVKNWFETFITKTITDVVNNFWEQQSKRLQESKKQREKKKRIDKEKKSKENLSNGIILDTSVLIDGRILDMVKTGFVMGPMIISKLVLNELHLISDSDEKLKREKGRRGLDVLKNLKEQTKVIILGQIGKDAQVDKELITAAKRFKIRLMTMDFNLNKVASVSGIKVLNINELVNAIKTVVLPGEDLQVRIVQTGKEKDQGVGYMPDGTMVVVEGAKELVGSEISTRVSRVIQTNAGKIIFCNISV